MISNYCIRRNSTIEEALQALKKVGGIGLIVLDSSDHFLGILTDGDIRRAVSNGFTMRDNIDAIYNRNPITARVNTPREDLVRITEDRKIKLVPIVEDKKLVDVYTATDDFSDVSVVIMAGGLGTRLGEFTKECPKPMLEVGGKPILERIIQNFVNVGITRFFISVNYMAEMIENYFGDGSAFECNITYLREPFKMGTAGSLSLLPTGMKGPVILTNGDLITLVDFRRLVTFHRQHKSSFTLCTRNYEFQVPFGVVETENGIVTSIVEKPIQSFRISAGVYIFDKDILKYIPNDKYFDMPTLVETLMSSNLKIENFPLVEEWIDIGQVRDLQYARTIYKD